MFLYYLFNILFTNPIIEWSIHKFFHDYKIDYHHQHHLDVHHDKTEKEYYFLIIIPALYYCNYISLSIGAFNYLATHTCIHFYPKWVDSDLLEHHSVHHMRPNYNFAVTSDLPDILFSTKYYKKI
tara:strand:+ start:451 stop:825 length:375 start_codon:yes stop_codon:yes gene_type:complete